MIHKNQAKKFQEINPLKLSQLQEEGCLRNLFPASLGHWDIQQQFLSFIYPSQGNKETPLFKGSMISDLEEKELKSDNKSEGRRPLFTLGQKKGDSRKHVAEWDLVRGVGGSIPPSP